MNELYPGYAAFRYMGFGSKTQVSYLMLFTAAATLVWNSDGNGM